MEFKFGKHAGRHISDPSIPRDYLEMIKAYRQKDIAAIDSELSRREALEEASVGWAEKVIKAGQAALAKRHHPDVGGDADEFKEMQQAVTWLRESVKQADEEAGVTAEPQYPGGM